MTSKATDITPSSGNVFADLGFAEPEAELAKAELARAIARLIHQRGWRQAEAATALDIDQSKISAIVRGRLGGFSLERLMKLLARLDQDIQIRVFQKRSIDQPALPSVELEDRLDKPMREDEVLDPWKVPLDALRRAQETRRRSDRFKTGASQIMRLPTSGGPSRFGHNLSTTWQSLSRRPKKPVASCVTLRSRAGGRRPDPLTS